MSNLTGVGGGDLAARKQAQSAAARPSDWAWLLTPRTRTGFGPVGQLGMARGIAG